MENQRAGSFERNINQNPSLSNVHKMLCLKGLLSGTAANVIGHFLIPDQNYKPAIDTLEKRFGQLNVLKSSHIATLKSVEPLYHVRDIDKL